MTVRVFVATSPGTDDLPAETTLEYSLRKNCSEDIEVVFMRNNNDPGNFFGGFDNEGWATPFTNLRWAIPSYCNFEGRAIYMDCDMVNFRDISELFNMDMGGAPLVCREGWRTCVMLMDCEKLQEYLPPVSEIKKDSRFNQRNARFFASLAKPIDERWNCLDGEGRPLSDIWHLHWTHMPTQPWRPAWAKETHEKGGWPFEVKDHPRTDLVSAWNKLRREAENKNTAEEYLIITQSDEDNFPAGVEICSTSDICNTLLTTDKRYVVYIDPSLSISKNISINLLDAITGNGTYISTFSKQDPLFIVWDTENPYHNEWVRKYAEYDNHIEGVEQAISEIKDRVQVLNLGDLQTGPLSKYMGVV